MLTNESGCVFVVLNPVGRIAGLFLRYETAVESVRMSVAHENPQLDIRRSDKDYPESVGVWLYDVFPVRYIASIEKHSVSQIAVGLVEL